MFNFIFSFFNQYKFPLGFGLGVISVFGFYHLFHTSQINSIKKQYEKRIEVLQEKQKEVIKSDINLNNEYIDKNNKIVKENKLLRDKLDKLTNSKNYTDCKLDTETYNSINDILR